MAEQRDENVTSDRAAAYLIDLLPIAVFAAITYARWNDEWKAVSGPAMSCAYLLLRDAFGASFGKRLMRLRVVSSGGGEASIGQRIARNLTIAIGPLIDRVPMLSLGHLVGLIVPLEMFVLLLTGRRLGDRLTGTTVVKVSRGES